MKQLTPWNLTLIQLRTVGIICAVLVVLGLLAIEFLPSKRNKWLVISLSVFTSAAAAGMLYLMIVFQGTVK